MDMKVRSFPSPPSFRLISKIGEGSSSHVYLGRRKQSPSHVKLAIKAINIKPQKHNQLVDEIRILKSLQNAHCVELLDFEWDKYMLYLVFEYCDKGSLSNYLNQHPHRRLPESQATLLGRQLIAGLQYLHANDIVHRDLKSDNILIKSNEFGVPQVKIADFGIAADDTESGFLMGKIGTLLYMAPEILVQKIYDPRCDLWSIGIILYEMITGTTPLSIFATDSNSLCKAILALSDKDIDLLKIGNTNRAYDNLVRSLLRVNPDDRISFERLFNSQFLDLKHLPSSACLSKGTLLIEKAQQEDSILLDTLDPIKLNKNSSSSWPPMSVSSCSTSAPSGSSRIHNLTNQYLDGATYLYSYLSYISPKHPNYKCIQKMVQEGLNRAEFWKDVLSK